MTNQEKIAYLRQYRVNELAIERTLEEIERLKSRAEKCTSNYSPIGGNGATVNNLIQDVVQKMDEQERKLSKQLDTALQLHTSISNAINTVSNNRFRLLLSYKYIDGKSLERIAELMNKSTRQIGRWHKKAVNVLECPVKSMILLD